MRAWSSCGSCGGDCMSKTRISFEAEQLEEHNSSAGGSFSWICLFSFIPDVLIHLQYIHSREGRGSGNQIGQVCPGVFTPTLLSDKAMFFPPLTVNSCSRGERCGKRCGKVIGKLPVSRHMTWGQINMQLPFFFLHWIQNPFLKHDVKT